MPRIDQTNKPNTRIAVSLRKSSKDNNTSAEVGKDAAKQVTSKVGSPVSVRKTFNTSSSRLPSRLPGEPGRNSAERSQVVSSATFVNPFTDWDAREDDLPPGTFDYLSKGKAAVMQRLDEWEEAGGDHWRGLEDFIATTNVVRSKFLVNEILQFDRPAALGGAITRDDAKKILRDGIEFLHAASRGRTIEPYKESEEEFADNIAVFFAVMPLALDRINPDMRGVASGAKEPNWELALRSISDAFNAITF